ncbi:SAM-dependent methyltransferase [Amphibiibacter pelophylacis]|uniref:Cyclopropane-fatty-acyl-phospholipid synthase family protein n=1 Tax=Amphibiibacter pelophylacis TaxID=1799477 RepID=A0ACC6P260_9BURK
MHAPAADSARRPDAVTAANAAQDDGFVIRACERGWLPDPLVRLGMRQLMRQRLRDEGAGQPALRQQKWQTLLADLRSSPIAIETQAANGQHYEVPAEFFHAHLGPHLKYSGCLYPTGSESLDQAEAAMLALYAQRAQLQDGQRVLDLGCGWGSFSLWAAAQFPGSEIVGLSNSHGQREFIEAQARERGLNNLRIVTGNIVDVELPPEVLQGGFDRVVSVEMFEHMKNYGLLLAKISRWMKDDAQLFVHIFAHRELAYHFEVNGASDWMSKYFFTGGTMPSLDLLAQFQDDLALQEQWWVDGTHYERTANHWLERLDARRAELMPLMVQTYGADQAAVWFQRWRMFYMAVAELFGYADGSEWGVAHYRFQPRADRASRTVAVPDAA